MRDVWSHAEIRRNDADVWTFQQGEVAAMRAAVQMRLAQSSVALR
jgi:hypothetical protein